MIIDVSVPYGYIIGNDINNGYKYFVEVTAYFYYCPCRIYSNNDEKVGIGRLHRFE